ncbi:MAG: leucine-rich repeat protein [Bacillales bacterium]
MNKNVKKSNKKRNIIIITFICFLISLLLGLFGCKSYNNNKYNKILNSLPKLNNEGYWIDKDNNKLTDIKSNKNNIDAYQYYNIIDNNSYNSVAKFVKDYNSKNLKKFKIDFFNRDNSLYKSREYNFLDKLEFPKDPMETGVLFKGWKLLNNTENENKIFTKDNKVIVDDNLQFKALYINGEIPSKDNFDVEFYIKDSENKLNLFKHVNVKKGEKIEEVNAPEKENNMFLGWYDEFDNKFDFNQPIYKDYKLITKYFNKNSNGSVNKFTVNIYDQNHNIVSSNIYELDTEIELKRYTNDYVYEYYYEEHNTIDKFDTIKDEDYFKFVVTKDINLIPKGHKKFIKFICEDADLSIVNFNGHPIEDDKVNVSTDSPINFAKVAKPNFYRVHKVIWQIDNNGVREDYIDTIYNNKYDLTLYYKLDPDMFDDVVLIEENDSYIKVVGLNEPYISTPDYKLTIPALINDKEVTNISGLNRNNNLKEVVLPNTVKYIDKEAFDLDRNLEKINLEDTKVEVIDDYAFRFCDKMETINFPSTLKSINESAFEGCIFKNLDFSSTNLENISKNAFFGLVELTDVKLPSSLKTIGDRCFGACHKLENINLEDTSVTSIGSEAFFNNKELKNVKLPSSCSLLGEMCFHGCNKLEKIDLSSTNVTNIPNSCFYWCTNLKEILLPSNLMTISDKAFYECNKLETISLENTKLVSIGEEAFQWCYKLLKSIKLPATFKFLSKSSFVYCKNILSVDLSLTQVESISQECFKYCEKIKTVLLPSSIKEIKDSAFEECEELETINLFNTSVETIGDSAFRQCNALKDIKLPSTLTKIGNYGFAVCYSALSIDLSLTSIETIGENTFYFSRKAKIIKLPSTLKSIDKKAFGNLQELDVIEFNGTQAEFRAINIDPYAFEYISTNPEIKFKDGTSIHFSDL